MGVIKEHRNIIIMAVSVAAAFALVYGGLVLYSGMSVPFYTVESGSMMHSDNSKVGAIDTGDMVIVKDPSKVCITPYVDAYGTGYKKFGDYGDVIIYEVPGRTPIIHRVMIEMTSNGDGTWKIPSLETYDTDRWECGGSPDAYTGTLTLKNVGYKNEDIDIDLSRYSAPDGTTGYVTMGDHNSPMPDPFLVTEDRIIAVAVTEIPWLGCIKLFFTPNDGIPGNSILLLVLTFALILGSIIGMNFVYERYIKDGSAKERFSGFIKKLRKRE